MSIGIHQSLLNPMQDIQANMPDGASTFQIFTRNPRTCKQRSSIPYEINNFNVSLIQCNVSEWVLHAPYCMNLATSDKSAVEKNISTIKTDIDQMSQMCGNKYYVLHPGSHLYNTNWLDSFKYTYTSIADYAKKDPSICICIETMSGAGTELMSDLEVAWSIVDLISKYPQHGICLDSCHVHASGFSIVGTLQYYAPLIKVLHLNNSIGACGSRIDRHAGFNHGTIPLEDLHELYATFQKESPNSPVVLETPGNTILEDFEILKAWQKELS